jgi:hypothetical protein
MRNPDSHSSGISGGCRRCLLHHNLPICTWPTQKTPRAKQSLPTATTVYLTCRPTNLGYFPVKYPGMGRPETVPRPMASSTPAIPLSTPLARVCTTHRLKDRREVLIQIVITIITFTLLCTYKDLGVVILVHIFSCLGKYYSKTMRRYSRTIKIRVCDAELESELPFEKIDMMVLFIVSWP